jgi:hypothetical protein
MEELEQLFDFLSDSRRRRPHDHAGYEYDAAKQDMIKRLNLQP